MAYKFGIYETNNSEFVKYKLLLFRISTILYSKRGVIFSCFFIGAAGNGSL